MHIMLLLQEQNTLLLNSKEQNADVRLEQTRTIIEVSLE